MKFFFWDLGTYVGRVLLSLLAGGGIALVAIVLAFIFWDKADIIKEELEEKGRSSEKFASLIWRFLALFVGILGCLWGLSAFIDLVRFFF
ncbi:MAG: hypothetical protein H5T91_09135 [Synergistetes bacterium]|nr:hypothetical protein [Synergistota bacterium]MDK2871315.1 hypothetical protein [bacterium]